MKFVDRDFKYIKSLADEGDIKSLEEVIHSYRNGYDVEQNEDEALKYEKILVNRYKELAGEGDTESQFELARYYFNGVVIERDFNEAFKYFKLASEKEHAEALFDLGFCYIAGKGIEKDLDKGLKFCKQSIEKGYLFGVFRLAELYYKGYYVEKDLKKACEAFKLLDYLGFSNNLMEKFPSIIKDLSETEKTIIFNFFGHLLKDKGESKFVFIIGLCYFYGVGTKQDYEKAIEYILRAFDKVMNIYKILTNDPIEINNDSDAKQDYENYLIDYILAKCFENGYGKKQDLEEAYHLYHSSAYYFINRFTNTDPYYCLDKNDRRRAITRW